MSDKIVKTNTGIGGFEIKGKVYDVDPGELDALGVDPVPVDVGDMTVDNNVKDFSKKTKTTLAQYLSDVTLGKEGSSKGTPNAYPVDPPANPVQEIDLSDVNGNPTPIAPTSNTAHFADQDKIHPYSEYYPPVADKIKKGKESSNAELDGNTLLVQVKKNKPGDILDGYRSDQVQNNTFHDQNTTVDNNVNIESPPPDYDVKQFTNDTLGLSVGEKPLSWDTRVEKAAKETQGIEPPGVPNKFPVSGPASLDSITDTKGYPAPIAGTNNLSHFAEQDQINQYSEHYPVVVDDIKKGKKDAPKAISGDELLSHVKKNLPGEVLDKYRVDQTSTNTFQDIHQTVDSSVDINSPPAEYDVEQFTNDNLGTSEGESPLPWDVKVGKAAKETQGIEPPGVPNVYPVSGPSSMSSLTDKVGFPAPIVETNNPDHFVNQTKINPYSTHYPPIADKIKKGKKHTYGVDGNKLLPNADVEGSKSEDLIDQYTDDQTNDNTFTNDSPAVDSSVDITDPPVDFDVEKFYVINNNLGKGSIGPRDVDSKNVKSIPFDQRAKLASQETSGQGQNHASNAYAVSNKPTPASLTDYEHNVPSPLALPGADQRAYAIKGENVTGVVSDVPIDKRQSGPIGSSYARPFNKDVIVDPVVDSKFNENASKGKKYKQNTDGNDLLREIKKNTIRGPVGEYTNSVLSNNRFSASSVSTGGSDIDHVGAKYDTSLNVPSYPRPISMYKMAQVGTALSLRASEEFPSMTNGFNPTGAGAPLGAILPSPNQLGILKINTMLLEAKDVLQNLSTDTVDPDSLGEIAPFGGQSWGNMNNVEEPFAGVLNLGQVALSLALTVAITLVFEGLAALLSIGSNGDPKVRQKGGIYAKGSSTFKDSSGTTTAFGFPPNLYALLGLRPTVFPFGDTVKAGVTAFFLGAAHVGEGLGSQLGTAALGAVTSAIDTSPAGANIVVARTIVRSGLVIAAAFDKIIKAFASNPIAGIQSITGLLVTIKESKLFSAMNVFSSLGDAILADDKFDAERDGEGKIVVSSIDVIENDSPTATITKSRLKGSTKLAWASNRSPALYLVPDATMAMQLVDNRLGAFRGPLGLSDEQAKTYWTVKKQGQSNKLSESMVKELESRLESEYVPFYFHDLRTSEIISFHAFLTSLSDDYTIGWDAVEGIGRVEPVKIYKGTTRKIGISFYVVATSKKDFDDMWVKINKLTTLAYPQYTKGRTLSNSDAGANFVQPFSQLIGASPIIRMRLGDLFRSNYSRFALTRLFGVDSGPTQFGGDPIEFKDSQETIQAVKDEIKKTLENLPGDCVLKCPDKGTYTEISTFPIPVPVGGQKSPEYAQELNIDYSDIPFFEFTVTRLDGVNVIVMPKRMGIFDIEDNFGFSTRDATNTFVRLGKKYDDPKNHLKTRVLGGRYKVDRKNLDLTKKTYQEIFEKHTGKSIANIAQLGEFLSEKNNSLVRSFNSVKGKGLAGVIESMNFDWYDRVTWETEPGSIAPKLCKVTLNFTPIHDISPGIDHLGYNRAPLYPVGNAMKHGTDVDESSAASSDASSAIDSAGWARGR